MKRLKADYIVTCNDKFEILENGEVLFDEKIIDVGYFDSDIPCEYLGENSVIMPGLINTHTHLEFSFNKSILDYGDFIPWLDSLIDKREDLFIDCKGECYKSAIDEMKKSGVVAFGEISSTGNDLKYLKHSPLKVVYFNEIIGSNPGIVDAMYHDFLRRFEESKENENEKLKVGVSIHSPYSVHPILMDKIIGLAKDMPIQTHFMESPAERKWLDKGEGEFKLFFEKIAPHAKPLITPIEFLKKFENRKVNFVHCVQANEEELKIISQIGSISHCPISNRLLNVGLLNLERVRNLYIPYAVATDGLSSNYSLNLFKEIRATLLMQTNLNIKYLAKDLIKSVTCTASEILGLNNGKIEKGRDADLITFKLPQKVKKEILPLHTILHTNEAERVYINGTILT